MQTKIAKLLEQVSGDDRVELVILNNGYVTATKEHKNNPSPQNIKIWRSMKEDLVVFIEKLEEKYNPVAQAKENSKPTWATFTDTKVQSAVLNFLASTGWDIKKSTFSTHCRTGKLTKSRKGLYTKAVVKKYAEKNLVHNGLGTTVPQSDENIATRKTLAEISRIEVITRRERFKFEVEKKEYIERGRVERELATRAVVLDQGLEFFFRAKVDEMVALVGGVADKAPLLLDMCMKEKDEQINRYARMDNFTIIIEDEN